jgi:hypothetical protein
MVNYKGFQIDVKRVTLNGDTKVLKYSVTQKKDNFIVTEGLNFDEDNIRIFTKYLKGIADDFLKDPAPYLSNYQDEPEYEEDLDLEPAEDYDEES